MSDLQTTPATPSSSQASPLLAEHQATSSASPTTLTFVTTSSKNGADVFVVTAFPKSYEEATVLASRLLGSYLTDPRPENLSLKYSIRTKEGKWVRADIDPLNWELVVGSNKNEVRVFEKRAKIVVCDICHLNDQVHLAMIRSTYGCRSLEIKESRLLTSFSSPKRGGHLTIDRPMSFSEAVESVKTFFRDNVNRQHTLNYILNEVLAADNSKFSFYYSNNVYRLGHQHGWRAFRPLAYTDPEVWRELVPRPGGLLGVSFDD